ncbi:MAG: polyphosphate kinase 2 family protein [Anaerolineae bacterium]|nr:polyphosphate kinase 2 family protein [Anaerolineae bacterium]
MKEQPLTLPPGKRFRLKDFDPGYTGTFGNKKEAAQELQQNLERLHSLQEMLYAQGKHALLIVLQAMDTGGKDGVIEHVMGAFNPQGVRVTSFKVPTEEELAHDFLWRIHAAVPRRGMIGIFNRSHYEDVLVVRVKNLAPEEVWQRRYDHINAFERLLADSGVTIVKFYLHISKQEQKERLLERRNTPEKQWKFAPGDLEERTRWDDYMAAFEDALTRCNQDYAPWYVIPSDRKWYRNLIISRVLIETMEKMELAYPTPPPDIEKYEIPD